MLNVHDYLAIRIAHQNNESKRSIARRLHRSQATVAKVIASSTGVPEAYRRKGPAAFPKLGPFVGRIDAILKADESAPPKQRHTAMQVYRRIVNEDGYRGKYDQVRRHIQKHRRERRETLVPLDHAPGERIECDLGQIAVDYPDGRRTRDVLIVTWSFSHAQFMIATPNQRTESVLHGMAPLSFTYSLAIASPSIFSTTRGSSATDARFSAAITSVLVSPTLASRRFTATIAPFTLPCASSPGRSRALPCGTDGCCLPSSVSPWHPGRAGCASRRSTRCSCRPCRCGPAIRSLRYRSRQWTRR